MNIFPDDRIFEIVARVADREKVDVYVIGGYVRDHIMGRVHPEKDIDIVVLGDGPSLARAVAAEISPDIKVTVSPDKASAEVYVTGEARVPGEKERFLQELRLRLIKVKREWLIQRVETVKTLS